MEQRLVSRLDKMSRREYQTERTRISVWTFCPNVDNRKKKLCGEKYEDFIGIVGTEDLGNRP